MRRTKMALVSLMAMVCLIGTAFAAFTWGDANTTGSTDSMGIIIDTSADDFGVVTAEISAENYTVANDLTAISVAVTYVMDDVTLAPVANMKLVVAVNAGDLETYVDFTNIAATEGDWLTTSGIAYGDKNTIVTITPAWKAEAVNTVEKYNALQGVSGNISVTVTVVPIAG